MAIIKSKKVFKDSIKLPSGRVINDYFRVTEPPYVIICARLQDFSVVMERQFKHAINKTVLALPFVGYKLVQIFFYSETYR